MSSAKTPGSGGEGRRNQRRFQDLDWPLHAKDSEVDSMDDRPNILWYCTDQQRFDTIGALGNRYVQTPTMDGLVDQGVAFTRAYCQSPICTPSRSSFLTGMYPTRLHNTRNGNESFPTHPPLVTKLLKDSGYECGLIGKLHLQSSGQRTEPRVDDGYSFFKFSHAPRDDWPEGHDYADWVREQGGDLDLLRLSDDHVPPELHQTKWASDMAIDFIDRERDTPWLLSVNIYDPHPPFTPPRTYADRFDPIDMPGPHFRDSDLEQQAQLEAVDFQGEVLTPEQRDAKVVQALYYAMIAHIDDQLARILRELDDTGQRDNTVVILTTDHGETLGDHGLMEKGCRFYEGLVRVPLIFSWPGHFSGSLRSNALVELLDIMPTVLELAGLEVPDYVQGKSLLPILCGEAPSDHHRDFVRCEYFDAIDTESAARPTGQLGRVSVGHGDKPDSDSFDRQRGSWATMYRDQRYKLVVYHGMGLGELYDLHEDPWEFDNLWDDTAHQSTKADLVFASFDSHVLLTTDVGSRRIAPM